MKKTLAAVAVLGAFAGSALAADVTLYGVVDTGLLYQHADADTTADATDTLKMNPGISAGNRWGIKGVEDLGNGLSVGFVLENGFESDTGKISQGGRIFGREANLFVRGGFGELSFGRVGQLTSGNGTYGIAGSLSPFGTTFGEYAANVTNYFAGYERLDNAITYKSPSFAGVNVYAQYSLEVDSVDGDKVWGNGTTTKQNEGDWNNSLRYGALGVTYKAEGLYVAAIVDTYLYGDVAPANGDDGYTYTLGGSYDFGAAKLYAAAQYFDNVRATAFMDRVSKFAGNGTGDIYAEGFGVTIGADVPVAAGTVKVSAAYMDGEDSMNSKNEFNKWGVSAGYVYPFSKRTNLYTVLSYSQANFKTETKDQDPSAVEFALGLKHSF